MYSVGVVYNTFPLPPGFADADTSTLEPLAKAVLDACAAHEEATLADLYDPDLMPPNLGRAHHALDRAVDRLYRRKRFTSERERVEYLFALYERMRAPLAAQAGGSKPGVGRHARDSCDSGSSVESSALRHGHRLCTWIEDHGGSAWF